MSIDRAALIAAFPEFGDTTRYPESQVTFWLEQAALVIDPIAYGPQAAIAMMLYAAHFLALGRQSASGSVGGGVVSSKSVGPVSKSYDTKLTALAGAGPWNATVYGQRYWQFARAQNAGPLYRPSARAGAPLILSADLSPYW